MENPHRQQLFLPNIRVKAKNHVLTGTHRSNHPRDRDREDMNAFLATASSCHVMPCPVR